MKKPERKNLIKISDYIWEIPKNFREDMRVPARLFASEKMLDDILEDRSLWQLVNLATLPGIYKYALAMPDIHEGYGSPVGGVSAFNLEEGIISPGICGYDINCLPPESKINLPFGSYLEIKDGKNFKEVVSFDLSQKKRKRSKIFLFLKRKEKNYLLKIETKLGFKIKLTKDHPLFTLEGKKEAKDLKEGDKVIIYPFIGVKYQKPENKKIIDKKDFSSFCLNLGLNNKGNKISQSINYLKKRKLLPLSYNSEALPYIIKIFGYALGDGCASISKNGQISPLTLWGKKEDLEEIKKDLENLKIKSSIFSRKRKHKIKNSYGKEYYFEKEEFCLRTNKAFTLLLASLGYPLGNKTKVKYNLPSWIKKAPLWQKRLFLASFFGAELSSPKTTNKYNFYSPTLNINKDISLKENGFEFLKEIKNLLLEFKIETSEIKEVEKLGNIGKTTGLRIQIKSNPENLEKFFSQVGFEYHQEKQKLANLGVAYLKYKKKILNRRTSIREKVRILYSQGIKAKELIYQFQGSFVNQRFIEASLWDERGLPRIAFNFPSFEEFVKNYSFNEEGLVIDEIEKIENEPYNGDVFDFTIKDKNHNFFADNFLVSNCGVRLLVSPFFYEEIKDKIPKLTEEIYRQVPSGVGEGGFWKLNNDEMNKVLTEGAKWIVEIGYGTKEDLLATESEGKLEGADPDTVSRLAKDRGRDQLGTIGAGNHFVEIQKVQEVYDEEIAQELNLEKNKVTVLIHCGSRGLGHQIASDYIRLALNFLHKNKLEIADKELAYFPFESSEGKNYFSAMKAGANFAFANRQLIAYEVRKAFRKILDRDILLEQIYDVAHNIVKIEEYDNKKLIIHRKGATRAFWSGHSELAEKYRKIGQPILIPGSMGTSSFLLIGKELSKKISFGSAPHGAGRLMSRTEAKKKIRGSDLKKELESKGISVAAGSMSGLAEEAPQAYKDVAEVAEVVDQIGIAKKIVKLKPIGVIKG